MKPRKEYWVDLTSIKTSFEVSTEWASIVDSMVSRGANGTKEQLDTIIDYLATNFGPDKK